jgi:hypothetical protein
MRTATRVTGTMYPIGLAVHVGAVAGGCRHYQVEDT